MPNFSSRSLSRLDTCHPDLIALCVEVVRTYDITILEGHRDEARQNQMRQEGKSQLSWPNSRHNSQPSLAVDFAPYIAGRGVSWDWADYHPLAEHVKATWQRLMDEGKLSGEYDLAWGGDWRTFKDGPHWQLDRRA